MKNLKLLRKDIREAVEARQQEMESILPGFYTMYLGVKIYSKGHKEKKGKKK